MLAGLPLAIALIADVAGAAPAYGPPLPPPPVKTPPTKTPLAKTPPKPPVKVAEADVKAVDRCPTIPANAQPGEIVVCGQRPEGYRLDPDVLAARRAMRGGGNRPKRPDRMRDTSCAVVGAAGCIGANPGINIFGAALTAAEIAARLARGQEIGSLFVTDPQRSEYQLYLEAKRDREAKEAEVAAAKAAKAKAVQQLHGRAVIEGGPGSKPAGAPAQPGPAQ